MTVSLFDIRVPAVLLRIDQNPFHHGTLGAVRSLGRAGVEVHVIADSTGSPISRSRYVRQIHPPPPPGSSAHDIALSLRRVAARVTRPAVLIPTDGPSAVAVNRLRGDLVPAYLLPAMPAGPPEFVAHKAELADLCAALDVPRPSTLVPDNPAQAAGDAWRLGLPVVAKWSRPCTSTERAWLHSPAVLERRAAAWERPGWQSACSPHSGLGPGWRNWFCSERPGLFRRLPKRTRTRITASTLGPAGARWVRDRPPICATASAP